MYVIVYDREPMFESLSDKLQDIFDRLGKRGVLREEDVKKVMREIRLALLEADVNYKVVKTFTSKVREKAVGEEVSRALNPAQQVIKIVHQELVDTLGEPGRLQLTGRAPYVIMLVGLQGSGKTTTAAKMALHLRSQGHFPLMVAADVYRPAAIEQLEVLGHHLGRIAVVAVLVLPLPGREPPLDIEHGSLVRHVAQEFRRLAEGNDPVPLRRLLLLPLAVLPPMASRHGEVGDSITLAGIPNFRLAPEVADQNHFVYAAIHRSNLPIG